MAEALDCKSCKHKDHCSKQEAIQEFAKEERVELVIDCCDDHEENVPILRR